MPKKLLIPLHEDDVAPRFDLTTEVLVVELDSDGKVRDKRVLILPHPSSEKLCHLILTEGIEVLICGGVEEEYFNYLTWKKVLVLDNIVGSSRAVVQRYVHGRLNAGDLLKSGITGPGLGSGPKGKR